MFTLQRTGPSPGNPRLVSREKLTEADFDRLARDLGAHPFKARKSGFVSARRSPNRQSITTLWNGKETSAVAEPGDVIVTNMSADRQILRDRDGNANVYVITADKFPKLYERDVGASAFGDVYRARATVEALFLAGGFEILAPWGELQNANIGYLLKNGDELYGNNKETFERTYVAVP